MNQTTETLFKLIRVAIGNEDDIAFSCSVNWQDVYGMSMKQGVGAIACDGLLSLNECDIDEELRYKWMGQSLVIEKKYAKQKQSIESLVAFYQRHGIRVMVLKGYGLSLNYPVPQHRPAGDIDIILFGDKVKSDELVERELGIKVKKSYEKHSSFVFHGVTVENHSTFFDNHSHPSNKYVNDRLFQLIEGRTESVIVGESCFEIPSSTFMALHLLRHTACDFAANSISLRQVLDWALLVFRRGRDMDWSVIESFVCETGMWQFYTMINTFCRKSLFIDNFPQSVDNSDDEELFLEDIINGKRVSDFPLPSKKIAYGIEKTLQFWQNRWKYRMVYNDSLPKLYISNAINRLKH